MNADTRTEPSTSEQMTRVGPGTVMGELMRQYWIPAAGLQRSDRRRRPGAAVLLGEKLIAFRDSAGTRRHDGPPLPAPRGVAFFGRNEEGGIRCVYHGWKFDVAGNCVDMPNVPAGDERSRTRSRRRRTRPTSATA